MGATKRSGRWWPLRRFVVVDRSMTPTLVPGQGLIAVRNRRARVGEIRVVEHPDRPGFWLVKRVAELLGDGRMRVVSDDVTADAVDSRTFGPVAVNGSYRLLRVVGPPRAPRSTARPRRQP